jgi:DNA polymerase (family 10)
MTDKATREQVAKHLEHIDIMKSLNGDNKFSISAYKSAARTIDTTSVELTVAGLAKVRGISKIADTILQFINTGTSDRYTELAAHVPVGLLEIIESVHGVGPAKAKKLLAEGVTTLKQLIDQAEQGKLDAKLAKHVLFARDTKAGRLPFDQAYPVAKAVLEVITPLVLKAELCGSMRRRKPTIKDLDVVACINAKSEFASAFGTITTALKSTNLLTDIINLGDVKAALRIAKYGARMNCDIWLVEPSYWGSALCYATGSKEHNTKLRALGVSKGFKINEYGIFDRNTGDWLGGENETDLYDLLGIDYVEPENR